MRQTIFSTLPSEQKSLVVLWHANKVHQSFTICCRDEDQLREWEVALNKLLNKAPSGWGEQGCISCGAAPASDAPVLCQSCLSNTLNEAPTIIEVPKDHKSYQSGALVVSR